MDHLYKKLLTYAYNVTGCYEDAKDIVQDTLEKYLGVDKTTIAHESNYLVRSVINTAINFKDRQRRRKGYGVWLPDPIATDQPELKLLREQTAGYTLLVLMERLDARERAVFILKEGFAYRHEEIAALLDISTENSRQLLTRGKKILQNRSFKPARPASKPVPEQYIHALAEADINRLKQLLVNDIQLVADGGKTVKVITDMVIGADATANLLQYVYTLFLHPTRPVITMLNHQPAVCFYRNDRLYACQILELDEHDGICNIYSVIDPEKLRLLERSL